jgi:uncharacterized protein (DUF1800 family)
MRILIRRLMPAFLAVCAYSQIVVYHTTTSVEKGTSRQFTAYVPLSPNTITWLVNGVQGGNSTVGTVTQTGLYTAPTVIPTNNVVAVQAKSVAFPNIVGAATVTITQPRPWVWSVSPSAPAAGAPVTISLNGSAFMTSALVRVNGTPWPTTYVNATTLRATGTFAAAGSYSITVAHPNPGGIVSDPVSVSVRAPAPITVTVSPTTATVTLGMTRQFTANNPVTWTATAGTISSSGLYTAPSTMPASSTVTIRATSTADTTKFAQATVTLQAPATNVTVSPATATVLLAATRQFTANVPVTWTATAGTISAAGLYTAPATMPASPTVTIRATSTADTSRFAQATVTLQAPTVNVTVTPATANVQLAATQQFSANLAVTWTATAGTISAGGLYTAPATMPASPTVTIRATSTADTSRFAQATVTLQSAPLPPVSPAYTAAARLLEQAAFGPTQQQITDVMQKGVNTWLDEQFAMSETPIPVPQDMAQVAAQTLNRMAAAPDQLRQRTAWALGQIIVISGNKNVYPNEYAPYLQLLSKHAFGNYRNLLKDITLSPQMGKYLDLANSNKPGVGGGANENYPRELMQLFSFGLVQLNPDGSPKLDAQGKTTPTYTQADVRQVALALTGWTYPTEPGSQPSSNNWENFSAPAMEPRPNNHDTTQKTLPNGVVLPAGQTVQQDLDGVIDMVFNHPNTGPFIATRLIRNMVMSNPSGAYIQRVAQVFNNNGAGVRGDLRAVVRAILTDAEARNDAATPTGGRLKDPLYQYISFVRMMGGTITTSTQMAYIFVNMGQAINSPPSVFGYYTPSYRIPSNPGLFGPEFQIYTPNESVLLANELYQMMRSSNGDPSVNLGPFTAAAGNPNQLLDVVNQRLFYGRMTPELRAALLKAVQAAYDNNQRVETALYLSILSGQFAVQY